MKKKIECSRCPNSNRSDLFYSKKDKQWYCSNCTCYKCFQSIDGHEKCKFCSTLYHEKDGCCKEEDVIAKIKNECFICGKEIVNNLSRYLIRGNSCDDCLQKVNDALKKNGQN